MNKIKDKTGKSWLGTKSLAFAPFRVFLLFLPTL